MKITTLLAILLITASSAFSATFDINGFAKGLHRGGREGWNKKIKEGGAAEYRSNGSKYRTFKPTVSNRPDGGIFISTKLNHIRRFAKDDWAQVEMTFDKDGKLVSAKAQITMGKNSFSTKLINASTASAGLAGASAGVTAAIAIGGQILKQLDDEIQRWNEKGGRANFPAVVEHNFNFIWLSVRP